ncbi:hypothetical protein DCS_06972 [Drechmeria coniospora]|uniref:Uncharacterized protein n=1 Tax=Drechmeria coniospora TaxID=98403 RepID=A0A151GD68_DRECN|nr:hypothetical protein DCS_06972 [Drechmeria coniospora]KYK55011.1 hypothetical protein DCS_06972 [Drechmeria coniospora]
MIGRNDQQRWWSVQNSAASSLRPGRRKQHGQSELVSCKPSFGTPPGPLRLLLLSVQRSGGSGHVPRGSSTAARALVTWTAAPRPKLRGPPAHRRGRSRCAPRPVTAQGHRRWNVLLFPERRRPQERKGRGEGGWTPPPPPPPPPPPSPPPCLVGFSLGQPIRRGPRRISCSPVLDRFVHASIRSLDDVETRSGARRKRPLSGWPSGPETRQGSPFAGEAKPGGGGGGGGGGQGRGGQGVHLDHASSLHRSPLPGSTAHWETGPRT